MNATKPPPRCPGRIESESTDPIETGGRDVHPYRPGVRFDGLEEYGGDFRNYAKPADSLVADILARRKQTRSPADPDRDPVSDKPLSDPSESPPGNEVPDNPDNIDHLDGEPVRLASKGRTLIVGRNADQVGRCGQRLAETLPCLMLIEGPDNPPESRRARPDGPLYATDLQIRGHLGRFDAVARIGRTDIRPSRLLETPSAHFDLVLDLRPAAETGRDVLPPGYYAPDGNDVELERVLSEMPLMRGVFEKPRFVRHRASECAVGEAGHTACRRCTEVCPTGALTVTAAGIRIAHAACTGCGLCTAVCPTGAMRCRYSAPEDLLVAVQDKLCQARLGDRPNPTVHFHPLQAADKRIAEHRDGDRPVLSFPVAEIGCVGPEVWLAALAYGAGRVVLEFPENYPVALQSQLNGQLVWVTSALAGLDLPTDLIQLNFAYPSRASIDGLLDSGGAPAGFSPFQSKRVLIRLALAHLADRNGRPEATIALPAGAPFGGLTIDASACTLCMACAGACPTPALGGTDDVPALKLTESECIQCGRCATVCPEGAVGLQPRMLLDPARSERPRTLCSQEPFACIRCGKPFAPPGMLNKMIERLEGHWMYRRQEDIRRLKMCRDCRIRDIFLNREAKRP